MEGGGGGVGGARCGFEAAIGVDEGTRSDVLEEDGESMPCTDRMDEIEGACCGEARISGTCCGRG